MQQCTHAHTRTHTTPTSFSDIRPKFSLVHLFSKDAVNWSEDIGNKYIYIVSKDLYNKRSTYQIILKKVSWFPKNVKQQYW